jgi:tRNA (Thr-GGU) A37 N-methylase
LLKKSKKNSDKETLQSQPYLEQKTRGIFAIRSPHQPNHLGFSVVKIKKIEKNRIYFTEVDMLEVTPLLDIKPYVKHFDSRDDVVCGWIKKHFKDGEIPEDPILR